MAYEKTTWATGDIISSSRMNNIEEGISTLDEVIGGGGSLTASRVLISDDSSNIIASDITSTELGYLDGLSGNVQTHFDTRKFKTYSDPSQLGLSTDCSIQDVVDNLPVNSEISFWINNSNSYANIYNEVLEGTGLSDAYGILTVTRYGTVWRVKWEYYAGIKTYIRNYTTLNSKGWSDWYCITPDDYVVSKGTSGIWTYRKYKSGVAECWGTQSFTPSWSVTNNVMYYCYTGTISLPFTFASITTLIAHRKAGTYVSWVTASSGSSLSTVQGLVMQYNNNGTSSVTISYYVRGTWE